MTGCILLTHMGIYMYIYRGRWISIPIQVHQFSTQKCREQQKLVNPASFVLTGAVVTTLMIDGVVRHNSHIS